MNASNTKGITSAISCYFVRSCPVLVPSPPRILRPLTSRCMCNFFNIPRLPQQLPYKTGAQNLHSRINEEQIKACLVQISRHRFSLVIAGLTKILQRVNELVRKVKSKSNCHMVVKISLVKTHYFFSNIMITIREFE